MSRWRWRHSAALRTLSVALFATLASGQRYVPIVATGTISGFQEGKIMFVKGGVDSSASDVIIDNQAFTIDLSTPWNTTSVPYKKITGATSDKSKVGTLTNNGQTFVILGTESQHYDLVKGTWKKTKPYESPTVFPRPTGVDPKTGKIYLYDSGDVGSVTMREYDPTSDTFRLIKSNGSGSMDRVLWSPYLKRFVSIGDNYESMSTWGPEVGLTSTATKGNIPHFRRDSCVVPAYNGTKMLVFGGSSPGATLDELFILDVETATWTQGTSSGAGYDRENSACAVTNDMFISWGGSTRAPKDMLVETPVLIYNIRTNAWQTTFSPDPYVEPKPTSSGDNTTSKNPLPSEAKPTERGEKSPVDGTPEDTPPGSMTKVPVIIGSTAAAIVALTSIGLFAYFRRRRVRKEEPIETEMDERQEGGSGALGDVDYRNSMDDDYDTKDCGYKESFRRQDRGISPEIGYKVLHQKQDRDISPERDHHYDLTFPRKTPRTVQENSPIGSHSTVRRNPQDSPRDYNQSYSNRRHPEDTSGRSGWGSSLGYSDSRSGIIQGNGSTSSPTVRSPHGQARRGGWESGFDSDDMNEGSAYRGSMKSYRPSSNDNQSRTGSSSRTSGGDRRKHGRSNLGNVTRIRDGDISEGEFTDGTERSGTRFSRQRDLNEDRGGGGGRGTRGDIHRGSNNGRDEPRFGSGIDSRRGSGSRSDVGSNNRSNGTGPSKAPNDPHARSPFFNGMNRLAPEIGPRDPELVSSRHKPRNNNYDNYRYNASDNNIYSSGGKAW